MTKKIETGTAGGSSSVKVSGCRRSLTIAAVLAACVLPMIASRAQAQTRIGPAPPITYDNKYELYGGLNYMDFKAGENLPKRMNLGGAEIEGTLDGVDGELPRRRRRVPERDEQELVAVGHPHARGNHATR